MTVGGQDGYRELAQRWMSDVECLRKVDEFMQLEVELKWWREHADTELLSTHDVSIEIKLTQVSTRIYIFLITG